MATIEKETRFMLNLYSKISKSKSGKELTVDFANQIQKLVSEKAISPAIIDIATMIFPDTKSVLKSNSTANKNKPKRIPNSSSCGGGSISRTSC